MNHPIKEILSKRKLGIHVGIPSFCTANGIVIEAILEYSKKFNDYVLIEATANQVNQFGGYMNMTPYDFVDYIYDIADKVDFPKEKLLLGADHFGPLAWADKSETEAMENAKELVEQAVLAGYTKIHLDTSMRLGSDDVNVKLSDEVIAKRGVELYEVCEEAFKQRVEKFPNSIHPVYVIGSEVPIPGGEFEEVDTLQVTSPNDFKNTINAYDKKFKEAGIKNAWDNIIAVVVQPGVEFSNVNVHLYEREEMNGLSKVLKDYPNLVFEGHSTDYQPPAKLKEMVGDGVAILKVGPACTFAFREGLFALSMMEKELIKDKAKHANFIECLEEVMIENPKDWQNYYIGSELEKELSRKYSFSDRSRYYMSRGDIESSIDNLFNNIDSCDLPLGLIKQFFPNAFMKILEEDYPLDSKSLVKSNVIDVVEDYFHATKAS
ncbi:class II D-tagatose-bisphosphate aldolase, non-catalytic subunit [Methanobrevibacter sp.]|uniref:class II D-tagatose-bisphosphate aldolase, non-catalytic subunit n=1 Tax=Methanobrevibacter sp. TaxID=66852 RepID=UPI0025DB76C2|nr:class II D-tagatose-bisphosphate aldolase, non-catalytic subunit [Methanobrevibacter sp.]MBQ6511871.1 class II D-tagatose-bisphosphate aldolase, non-catalytic subunit [Methanobrevibacter sp.]